MKKAAQPPKKETDGRDLLLALEGFNEEWKEWEECDCDELERRLFGAFQMKKIVEDALHFPTPVVFAVEYVRKGSRLFFCTSWKHFPHYFMRVRDPDSKFAGFQTWHEILPLGRKSRLYFDLEYYPGVQQGEIDIQKMLLLLKKETVQFFGRENDLKFVELDATLATKFSQHWIVHGCEFPDAFSAGSQIHKFLQTIWKELLVVDKNGKDETTLVDSSVYSSGQNLRLLGSPKFGRDNVLRFLNSDLSPTVQHPFTFHPGCAQCADLFMDSLASHPAADDQQEFWKAFAKNWSCPEDVGNPREELYLMSDCLLEVIQKSQSNSAILNSLSALLSDHAAFLFFWIEKDHADVVSRKFADFREALIGLETEDAPALKNIQFHGAEIWKALKEASDAGMAFLNDLDQSGPVEEEPKEEKAGFGKKTAKLLHRIEQLTLEDESKGTRAAYQRTVEKLPKQLLAKLPEAFDVDAIKSVLSDLNLDAESKKQQRRDKARAGQLQRMHRLLEALGEEVVFRQWLTSVGAKRQSERVLSSLCQSLATLENAFGPQWPEAAELHYPTLHSDKVDAFTRWKEESAVHSPFLTHVLDNWFRIQ